MSVADSGPGIPAQLRERIFEPFFTTKPAGEGTGLGLSIARDIVTEHGGFMDIGDSGEGGAVVNVYLPQGEPHAG
jgi:two-component system NtrC family sensor kinase